MNTAAGAGRAHGEGRSGDPPIRRRRRRRWCRWCRRTARRRAPHSRCRAPACCKAARASDQQQRGRPDGGGSRGYMPRLAMAWVVGLAQEGEGPAPCHHTSLAPPPKTPHPAPFPSMKAEPRFLAPACEAQEEEGETTGSAHAHTHLQPFPLLTRRSAHPPAAQPPPPAPPPAPPPPPRYLQELVCDDPRGVPHHLVHPPAGSSQQAAGTARAGKGGRQQPRPRLRPAARVVGGARTCTLCMLGARS